MFLFGRGRRVVVIGTKGSAEGMSSVGVNLFTL